MSLRGSIQTIGLPDVLTLLASTGKSGELHVRTDRGEGRLWFDAGRLSDHDVAHCPGAVDALFELLRGEDGTFSFSDRAERTGGDLTDVAPLLALAQERLEEWKGIAAVVPSVAHRVRLVADAEVERVELDKDQWALVLAVGEGNRVRVVLDRRSMGEFDGCRSIKGLVEMGLAQIDDAAGTLPARVGADNDCRAPGEPLALGSASDLSFGDGPDLSFGGAGRSSDGEPGPSFDGEPAQWALAEASEEHPTHALLGPQADDLLRAAVADVGGWQHPAEERAGDEQASERVESLTDTAAVALGYDEEPTADAVLDGAAAGGEAAVDEAFGRADQPTDEAFGYADQPTGVADGGSDVVHEGDLAVSGEEPFGDTPGVPVSTDDHADDAAGAGEAQAALRAMLAEVAGVSDEPLGDAESTDDGTVGVAAEADDASGWAPPVPAEALSDRGPWTSGELAGLEHSEWWPGQPGDVTAEAAEASAPEASEAPAEEPINRGLLLKFLSSVRN